MKDIQKFITGFKNFRDEYFCVESSPFEKLAKGQAPSTMVIACCDSRTDPSLIMQCEPGEIFVVRNIANIVPPYEPGTGHHSVSAAIEYAVNVLGISHIIVLGHSNCGGIQALMENKAVKQTRFVGTWLSTMQSVRDEVLEHFDAVNEKSCTACEMGAVLQSIDNLMTFPWVEQKVAAGDLALHGWYFSMQSGQLLGYRRESRTFEPLTSPCPDDAKTT